MNPDKISSGVLFRKAKVERFFLMDDQKKKQILIHFKCSCSPICISVPPFLEELLLIGTWIKEWEEEIVAMNHHFDESNDLIFTVFIIVIKTFPQ